MEPLPPPSLAASGYLDISDTDLLVNTAWAGQTVEYWAVNSDGWDEHYLPLRPEDGFDGAWLDLCERATDDHPRRDLGHPSRDGITFLGSQLQPFFDC